MSARNTRRRFNSERSAPASGPATGVCYCAEGGTTMTSVLLALLDGRLLSQPSRSALTTNRLGNLVVQLQPTAEPHTSRPYPLGAGSDGWSLGFQIASAPSPGASP